VKIDLKNILLVLALGWLALAASGCATTESENVSSRPWNAPKGWEFGVPGMDQMH